MKTKTMNTLVVRLLHLAVDAFQDHECNILSPDFWHEIDEEDKKELEKTAMEFYGLEKIILSDVDVMWLVEEYYEKLEDENEN